MPCGVLNPEHCVVLYSLNVSYIPTHCGYMLDFHNFEFSFNNLKMFCAINLSSNFKQSEAHYSTIEIFFKNLN